MQIRVLASLYVWQISLSIQHHYGKKSGKIQKFRRDRVKMRMGFLILYKRKGSNIYPYMRKPLVINDFQNLQVFFTSESRTFT